MSRRGTNVEITVDELISTLLHSSMPTVVVEGREDIVVYRRLEEEYEHLELSVIAAGGRSKVLSVFNRKSELANHKKIVFIADRDVWVITGIPVKFLDDSLIFTTGYSIENDVYEDGNLERLMTVNEKAAFATEVDEYLRWYSLALTRHLADSSQPIDIHPAHLFEDENKKKFMKLQPGEVYPEQFYNSIKETYLTQLRGKALFWLLMRQLSYKGRPTHHQSESLIENVATLRGNLINSIFSKVALIIS